MPTVFSATWGIYYIPQVGYKSDRNRWNGESMSAEGEGEMDKEQRGRKA